MKEVKVESFYNDNIACREDRLIDFYADGWRLITVDDHVAYLERDAPVSKGAPDAPKD